MNKIRGSVMAKLIAWVLCVTCAVSAIVLGIVTAAGMEVELFDMTREEALEDAYGNVNMSFSTEAYQSMKSHQNQKLFAEEGFYYGILQTDNLAKLNFRDKNIYLDTNMTEEQLQNMDTDKLSLYMIQGLSNGGSQGSYYGCVGDWDDLSILNPNVGNLEEEIVWESQYADAVCYDRRKGIFYYLSEEHYYPIQVVSLYYTNLFSKTTEYGYVYVEEKGKYQLDWTNVVGVDYGTGIRRDYLPDEEIEGVEGIEVFEGVDVNDETVYLPNEEITENAANEVDHDETIHIYSVEDSIENILKGDDEHYVDFRQLNNTQFSYKHWGTILFDNIRELQGEELTIIDSNAIEPNCFVTSEIPGYYLDENYTLHVAYQKSSEYFWVISLIPDTAVEPMRGSRYSLAAKSIELFYDYKDYLGGLMTVTIIVTLVSFVFLAYAAGYRKNREGIVLTWFDKLPLEVISAAAFFAEFVPGCVLGMTLRVYDIDSNAVVFNPLMLGAAAVAGMIALWYILSLCVRIKCGKWWRNTICYKVLNFVFRLVKNLFDNITLVWKMLLILLIKSVLELLVLSIDRAGNGVIELGWLIENVFLCAVGYYAVLQVNALQKAAEKMAGGDLGYKVDTEKMFSACKNHGENLNKIGEGMLKAVDERIKSERFKTELITNVSHDIKTPLTSIINYVDLLEKEELHNEKAEEYLAVLERQSSKLKKLIEDLVEASKASTGNLEVGNELLEAGVFLTQTVGEFEEKLSLVGLELIVQKPEAPLYILADGRHLWRVVDNLMNNICKYAQPSSRVYVNLEKEDEEVVMTFRNISKYQLNINGGELTERFVRGDSSRNTEGHGLGLSIAKSLMDLIGGDMRIVVDGDLFKVILRFELQKEGPRNDEQDDAQEDAE